MSEFYNGLAEIFEVDAAEIGPDFDLAAHNWDSLAVISTIALVDECFDRMVDGSSMAKCDRVRDIEALVATASAG